MKKIVVLGASRGIGAELLKIFAEEKNVMVLGLARNLEKLNFIRDGLSAQAKEKTIVCRLDLEDEDVNHQISSIIKERFGEIDVLINNAGYLLNKPFHEISRKELRKVYEINVFGIFECIKGTLNYLNSGAHIVNISSMGGFQGASKFPGLSAYSSSKGALCCLTECLAEELKEKDISVNALALGAVQTEMLEEAFPGYLAPVTANQMARYIHEFAHSASRMMNGKILPVSISTP